MIHIKDPFSGASHSERLRDGTSLIIRNIVKKILSVDFDYDEEDVESEMTEFLAQVAKYTVNIDELTLYKPNDKIELDTCVVFTNSNSELYAILLDYDLRFFRIENMLFDDTDLILTHKNDNIEYILYAFEQCREVPVLSLYDKNDLVSIDVTKYDGIKKYNGICIDCNISIKWIDDMYLDIGHNDTGSIVYIISKDNEIVSAFVDEITHFQLGDACTLAYLYNNDLIIENCGDVSSLVIIKYSNMTKSAYKT